MSGASKQASAFFFGDGKRKAIPRGAICSGAKGGRSPR